MAQNKKKPLSKKARLAALFASFTILIVGSVSLFENMSFDYYTVLGTLGKVIPASLAMGALGWVMGIIIERPGKIARGHNIFLDSIIKEHLPESESSGEDNEEAIGIDEQE